MKSKMLLSIFALFLLVGSVSAVAIVYDRYSVRGDKGTINFIGDDNEFQYSRNSFSANARVKIVDREVSLFGSGILRLQTVNMDGDRVILTLNLKPSDVNIYEEGRIYIDNEATGVYYSSSTGRQKVKLDSVRFDIVGDLINIAGGEGTEFAFRVTGMNAKYLI